MVSLGGALDESSRCQNSFQKRLLPRSRLETKDGLEGKRVLTMTEQSFNRRREDFPTLASGIHLLSHSLGPVPRAARNSMLAYYDAWEQHTSEDAWATN